MKEDLFADNSLPLEWCLYYWNLQSEKRNSPFFIFFWQVISSDRTLAPKNQMHKSKEIQLLSFPTLPDEDAQEKQKLA